MNNLKHYIKRYFEWDIGTHGWIGMIFVGVAVVVWWLPEGNMGSLLTLLTFPIFLVGAHSVILFKLKMIKLMMKENPKKIRFSDYVYVALAIGIIILVIKFLKNL